MKIKAGVRIYRVGKSYEYMLMYKLKKCGYFVMRGPGSGRGHRGLYAPDVVAVKKGRVLFIEVKYLEDGRPVYLEKEKFNKLKYIVNLAGAIPLICVFYKDIGDFRCLESNNYDRTTNEYYVYNRRSFIERGKKVEDL